MASDELERDGSRSAARKPYTAPRVIFSELQIKENTASTKLRGSLAAERHTTSSSATS